MDRRVVFVIVFLLFAASFPSCLKDAPEELPTEFEWNPEIAFPVTSDSLGMNEESGFDPLLLETNPITGDPYWVELVGVPIEGDAAFNLANIIYNSREVNRIMIRVNAYNGFPADVLLQSYFEEQGGFIVDSMFSDGPLTLSPGRVNSDGETVTPSFTTEDAFFDRDRLDAMEQVVNITFKTIILNARLDSTLIPFYPDYKIDIQLAAMLDITP